MAAAAEPSLIVTTRRIAREYATPEHAGLPVSTLVYLLLTENPALQYSQAAFLATKVRNTGIGRALRSS
ncbi:hypothetical protein AB0B12_40020 [Streptomyces sp. NPDC044780]|uniref:hypothetical protein n=1 Tax=Streptomyces sp. NPDC044780 TaxID=3157199 RepID=UPI0033D920EF